MITSDSVITIIRSIIEHQKVIIGPLAIDQARKVPGLVIENGSGLKISVKDVNLTTVIDQLVNCYEELFGQTSIEVCKEAIKESSVSIKPEELPPKLRS